jgi:hypothetical protein
MEERYAPAGVVLEVGGAISEASMADEETSRVASKSAAPLQAEMT